MQAVVNSRRRHSLTAGQRWDTLSRAWGCLELPFFLENMLDALFVDFTC